MSDYENRGHCHKCGAREGECSCLADSFPSFEDWKLDLTSEKLSEQAQFFYIEKIGPLVSDILKDIPNYKAVYELAEDAEDFILEDIVAGVRFEDEFYDYLKEQYKEEGGR